MIKVSTIVVFPLVLAASLLNLFRDRTWSYDIDEYQAIYDAIGVLDAFTFADYLGISIEPGFLLLSWLFGLFFAEVNFLLFALSAASLFIKLIYIPGRYFNFGVYIFWPFYFLTYFILLELTQTRMAVTSAVLLLSYHFLALRKFGTFIALVFFASAFHYSAIIALIATSFYLVTSRKVVFVHIALIASLVLVDVFLRLDYAGVLLGAIDPKKASYLAVSDFSETDSVRIFLVLAYQLFIAWICRPNSTESDSEPAEKLHWLLFNLYILSIGIYVALNNYGVVAVRLAEVFRNLEPFLVFIAIFRNRSHGRRLLIMVAVIVSIAVNAHKNNRIVEPINSIFKDIGITKVDF